MTVRNTGHMHWPFLDDWTTCDGALNDCENLPLPWEIPDKHLSSHRDRSVNQSPKKRIYFRGSLVFMIENRYDAILRFVRWALHACFEGGTKDQFSPNFHHWALV